jgi:hypothetical protein
VGFGHPCQLQAPNPIPAAPACVMHVIRNGVNPAIICNAGVRTTRGLAPTNRGFPCYCGERRWERWASKQRAFWFGQCGHPYGVWAYKKAIMNTPILYIFYAKLQYTPYTAHTSSLTTIIPHLLMIYIDDRHINHARAPQCCNPDPRCRPETYCPGPGLQVDGSLLRTTAVSTCCSVPTPPQSLNPANRSPETRRHSKHGESHAGGEYHNVLTAAALRAQVSPQYWNPEICESGPRDSGTVGRRARLEVRCACE